INFSKGFLFPGGEQASDFIHKSFKPGTDVPAFGQLSRIKISQAGTSQVSYMATGIFNRNKDQILGYKESCYPPQLDIPEQKQTDGHVGCFGSNPYQNSHNSG